MTRYESKYFFDEVKNALAVKGADNIFLEDTNNRYEKILCMGDARVGKIKISYPDGQRESNSCCDVDVSFDFYVKDEQGKFDWFIDKLIGFSKVR